MALELDLSPDAPLPGSPHHQGPRGPVLHGYPDRLVKGDLL
jgi:hypothetical protein